MSNHRVNLTKQETDLIDEADPHALEGLDAKALKDLQSRLRRQGAARVEAEGGRGAAEPANERRGEKVNVFDDALARVSERLESLE